MTEPQSNARLFASAIQIKHLVDELAHRISVNTSEKPSILVAVMGGACCFAPDLLRALNHAGVDMKFFSLSVKRDFHGHPLIQTDPGLYRHAVNGKRALIVDTIHDSGDTARMVMKHTLIHGNAKWADFACLLVRDRTKLPEGFDNYVGFDLKRATEYYYGYGLDRNGAMRGLSSIYAESPSTAVPESLLAP